MFFFIYRLVQICINIHYINEEHTGFLFYYNFLSSYLLPLLPFYYFTINTLIYSPHFFLCMLEVKNFSKTSKSYNILNLKSLD